MVAISKKDKEAHIRLFKPFEHESFKTGEEIIPFKAKAMDGFKFDMKEMAGKVVVINFWFVDCLPCRQEIPDFNLIVQQYHNNDNVVFMAVALDETYKIKNFLKTQPFAYHIVSDGKDITDKYNLHSFPVNVVIDQKGKIAFSSRGDYYGNPYWIKKTIDELLTHDKS